METFSPLTRRFIALGLLFVAIVSGVNLVALPLWLLLQQSLDHLGDTRFQRLQDEAIVARGQPAGGAPVPATLYAAAASRSVAMGQLTARIRTEAAGVGIRLLSVNGENGAGPSDAHLSATIAAEGEEVALMKFVIRLERDPPLVRFRRWRIAHAPTEGAPLRLDGQIDAAWSNGR